MVTSETANAQPSGDSVRQGHGFRLATVGFGAEAREALAQFVTRAKAADPLAAVTVVVPSNYTGLSLRRELGGGSGGVAVLETLTIAELADRLGGSLLQRDAAATGERHDGRSGRAHSAR